jgi:hypothetical protein
MPNCSLKQFVKKAKDYSRAKQVYFKPEIKLCPHCHQHLRRSHIAWRKHVFTLKETLHITSHAYRCKNKACPKPKETYRSAEAEMLCLKYYQFSIDVIAKIGHLYFKEHKTIDEIKQTLCKLQISRSEVNLLYQAYLALTTANKQQDTTLLNKIRANGGIILALDGVQPEKGNETLWILKDQNTTETLLAKNLATADRDSLASLLREIKALGIQVKGVISDGQRSIRLAVKQEFPNVPHQLCHFHFLHNIARPISEMDRALKVDLKKKVRGIKPIEQNVACRTDKQSQLIFRYCQAIRFTLQDDGCYPLEPGGLKLYRRLRTIQHSLELDYRVHPNLELERLLRKLSIVDELKPQYRRIKRLYALIFEVNRILRQEANSGRVESDMLLYFEKLTELCPRRQEERVAVQNILRFMASYWEGLFYHYDCMEIPRTNNDLERFIRKLKVAHRKTTGRVSCQGYIVRYGAYVALLDDSLSQSEVLFRLRLVGDDAFRRCFCQIRGFRGRLSLKRSLSRNFNVCIRALELEWAKIPV